MSLGGIYDHIGGGLSRYSVDEIWLVPHFEKMLYDNAHYVRHLAWAYKIKPSQLFRSRIEQTVEWLEREMLLKTGAFASSLDADSEGKEGKFYVWSVEEIRGLLATRSNEFISAYGITESGNFEGENIPNLLHIDNIDQAASIRNDFAPEIDKLLRVRQERIPPGKDDKILTDWNGYIIRALAETGFQFANAHWIELAKSAFHYISESISEDDHLPHSYRDGAAIRPAMATDYSSMINASITLSEVTGEASYLDKADAWLSILENDYSDDAGGFYLTSTESESLLLRPRCDMDEANPSAASQILEAYVRYSATTSDKEYLSRAWNLAWNINSAIGRSGHAASGYFNALHSIFNHRHIKIFAEDGNSAQPFLDVIRNQLNIASTFEIVTENKPTKFHGHEISPPAVLPSAIMCTSQSCSHPITEIYEFRKTLTS
ncbi:MAG: thioredoxin domain-containing protein [Rhizobiaceae bacterium]